MKIQLDTVNKIIILESTVKLSDLIKHLDQLLPKNSPFGHWKGFNLQTNTVINNWANPIYVPYLSYPWWISQPSEIICDVSTVINYDIGGGTYTASNGVFNLELN